MANQRQRATVSRASHPLELRAVSGLQHRLATALQAIDQDFLEFPGVPWTPTDQVVEPLQTVLDRLAPDLLFGTLVFAGRHGGALVWFDRLAVAELAGLGPKGASKALKLEWFTRYLRAFALKFAEAWQPLCRLDIQVTGSDETPDPALLPVGFAGVDGETPMVVTRFDVSLPGNHRHTTVEVAVPWPALAGLGARLRHYARGGQPAQLDGLTREQLRDPERVMLATHLPPLTVELGANLLQLIDADQDGELMARVAVVRTRLATDLGFTLPGVCFRDNLHLDEDTYRIFVKDHLAASGQAFAGRQLALSPGTAAVADGKWVEGEAALRAERRGLLLLDAVDVVAARLEATARAHAAELLSLDATRTLLDQLARATPVLVETALMEPLGLSGIHGVLRQLLQGGTSIRNLGGLLEQLVAIARPHQTPVELAEWVRAALPREATAHRVVRGAIAVIGLSPLAIFCLRRAVRHDLLGTRLVLAPRRATWWRTALSEAIATHGTATLVCPPDLRPALQAWLSDALPGTFAIAVREVAPGIRLDLRVVVGWSALLRWLTTGGESLPDPVAARPDPGRATRIWHEDTGPDSQAALPAVPTRLPGIFNFLAAYPAPCVADALREEYMNVIADVLMGLRRDFADEVLAEFCPHDQELLLAKLSSQPPLNDPQRIDLAARLRRRLRG